MEKKRENDVVMMELPEYEEEYPPFAEAEMQEISFVVNKEEIYKQNRLIAAKEQSKQLADEEKAKEEKRAEFESIYTEAASSEKASPFLAITGKKLAIIVAASVLGLLLVVMAANMIAKTDVIERTDGTMAYDTDSVSYKFAVHYEENENGTTMMIIDVTAKNMTDYEYYILPNKFYLSAGDYKDYDFKLSNYDNKQTVFESSYNIYEDIWEQEIPIAFSFDENNLCSFTLTEYLSDSRNLDSLGYSGDNGWEEHYKTSESFEIPLDSMTAP